MNSIDEIIQLYKRDVDLTLIDESLRLSVEERIRNTQQLGRFGEELRAGMERQRDAVR